MFNNFFFFFFFRFSWRHKGIFCPQFLFRVKISANFEASMAYTLLLSNNHTQQSYQHVPKFKYLVGRRERVCEREAVSEVEFRSLR